MIVKYVAGNSGKEFILNQSYEIKIRDMNAFASSWTYTSVARRFGAFITQFGKDMKSLPITLKVQGAESGIKSTLNAFFAECEKDIINLSPGKLWIGDEYAQGYFVERETGGSSEFYGALQNLAFLMPYPFWIKELKRSFWADGNAPAGDGLDYPHDYPFDYAAGNAGIAEWATGHFAPSEFKMIIYGPATDPRITIGGHAYQIFDEITTGEYVTIDSRKYTVEKNLAGGASVNIFDLRGKEQSVFEPIPAGTVTVSWNGSFGFDITLFLERGEPSW